MSRIAQRTSVLHFRCTSVSTSLLPFPLVSSRSQLSSVSGGSQSSFQHSLFFYLLFTMSLSSFDQASTSEKRFLSPSLPDLDLLIRGHAFPDRPSVIGYSLNYVDPSELLPTDVVEPHSRSLSFHWDGCFYSLVKISSCKRFLFDSSDPGYSWLSHFLSYLVSTGFHIPLDSDDTRFELAKNICKLRSASEDLPEVPIPNSFAVLAFASVADASASPLLRIFRLKWFSGNGYLLFPSS